MTAITIADLSNAKLDVDHIAAIATSLELTATDRLGNIKNTVAAAIDSIKAFTDRGAWVTATAYAGKDLALVSGTWYVCVVPHTSSAAFATDTASKWRVYQGVTLGALAASDGASLQGYLPGGVGALATTVQARLRKFATDSTAPESSDTGAYAAIAVNGTRTTINKHAFEDWTTIATGAETGMGYSSFDAQVTMTNAAVQSHLVGYQARNVYNGSGGLADYFHGYNVSNFHNGTGVVTTHCGMNISGLGGTGPVLSDTGLQINAIVRGSVANFGIWSGNGNAHYFGGDTGTTRTGVSTALEQVGTNLVKSIGNVECGLGGGFLVNLHYSDGWKYRGNGAGLYVGISGAELQINTVPVNAAGNDAPATPSPKLSINVATGVVTTASAVVPGSFLFSALPAGMNGAVTYCSNGRKVGEGVGAGTGVPVYYSGGAWRVFSTDAAVAA